MSRRDPRLVIRRLLALAKNPNPHEAKRARAKADALLARHGLTEAEALDADPELPAGMARCAIDEGRHQPLHMRFAGGLVGRFFHVKAIGHMSKPPMPPQTMIHLIGKADDVSRGEYAYYKLRDAFRESWTTYRKEENERYERTSKAYGAFTGDDGVLLRRLGVRKIAPGDRRVQLSYYQGLAQGIKTGMDERLVRMALPPAPAPVFNPLVPAMFQPRVAVAPAPTAVAMVKDPVLDQVALKVFSREKIPEKGPTRQHQPDEAAIKAGYRKGLGIVIELVRPPEEKGEPHVE